MMRQVVFVFMISPWSAVSNQVVSMRRKRQLDRRLLDWHSLASVDHPVVVVLEWPEIIHFYDTRKLFRKCEVVIGVLLELLALASLGVGLLGEKQMLRLSLATGRSIAFPRESLHQEG